MMLINQSELKKHKVYLNYYLKEAIKHLISFHIFHTSNPNRVSSDFFRKYIVPV